MLKNILFSFKKRRGVGEQDPPLALPCGRPCSEIQGIQGIQDTILGKYDLIGRGDSNSKKLIT
jgi:hypothetical protein